MQSPFFIHFLIEPRQYRTFRFLLKERSCCLNSLVPKAWIKILQHLNQRITTEVNTGRHAFHCQSRARISKHRRKAPNVAKTSQTVLIYKCAWYRWSTVNLPTKSLSGRAPIAKTTAKPLQVGNKEHPRWEHLRQEAAYNHQGFFCH